ncbi:xanthine dehydrogenase molybdopterin binding subunit [Parahalioglobus pacificus]|uniref:Xanthine dehydrogenase molybdopterin binding subunit n=1 Tax=Parahalioglobus pacificus TaxID=930806 RepID=A0A919CHF2_9GAMM|nr:xanthine dehydrogenase molybdopterin binding subunit [Halioglobus pacificus]GHD25559.1 xanthine dehydrogenase molybdopterin binding subunit [Halioglobus pacificus]
MRKLPDTRPAHSLISGRAGSATRHESAHKHVSGDALYVDDIPEPAGMLYGYVGLSSIAHATLKQMNLDAVRTAPGVMDVVTAKDLPALTDIGPVFPGDHLLAEGKVNFHGQVLFAVAATSQDAARRAARLADVKYEAQQADLTLESALAQEHFVRPTHTQRRGDADTAIATAPNRLSGHFKIGGQEQMYLEGQIALSIPGEDGSMLVHSSTQHPAETQKLVAEVLGLPMSLVTVTVRRMGGAFGGKETNANQWACLSALLARRTGRPVKLRLARADDMTTTGKRHPFHSDYEVGFDDEGRILGLNLKLSGNCGHSPDLSDAIVDRAMFHADNCYFLPAARIIGNRVKTHTASNTAFRGFGGPQGMLAIEQIIENIAQATGQDALDIRQRNFYGPDGRNVTHYGQTIEQHIIAPLVARLTKTSEYRQRREAVRAFNSENAILKRGLALTPVKFGISFTVQHLNQAGALLHVYTDGSIQLNHGGTEMGQGLYTKVAQVVASEFGVDLSSITCTATRTDKVPNTSPTAASSGSDLNGMAARDAARKIRQRLTEFAAEKFAVPAESIQFANDHVSLGAQRITFAELVQQAYLGRISLSATGYYRTPKIHYDRANASGRPFFYYAYGAACSEVLIDTLTGENRVLRVDICQDVGQSLNPVLDIGQIEGGFIQGMGWLTTEELVWNEQGRLLTNNPASYKIPTIGDTPPVFNVELMPDSPNTEATIFHSKAVGEPPLMLGISVWAALRDAVASIGEHRTAPLLDAPATPERILAACDQVRAARGERQ